MYSHLDLQTMLSGNHLSPKRKKKPLASIKKKKVRVPLTSIKKAVSQAVVIKKSKMVSCTINAIPNKIGEGDHKSISEALKSNVISMKHPLRHNSEKEPATSSSSSSEQAIEVGCKEAFKAVRAESLTEDELMNVVVVGQITISRHHDISGTNGQHGDLRLDPHLDPPLLS